MTTPFMSLRLAAIIYAKIAHCGDKTLGPCDECYHCHDDLWFVEDILKQAYSAGAAAQRGLCLCDCDGCKCCTRS